MNEIKGLSPAQLKNKFSLKYEPSFATPVTMAEGSTVRIGTAGKIKSLEQMVVGFKLS